jgi:hydrogen cyanide synthase HcnC
VTDSQEDVGFDTRTRIAVLKKIADRNTRIFSSAEACLDHPHVGGAARHVARRLADLRSVRAVPGAFGATCHSGVTLAGAHALALAPAILEGALPSLLSAFSSARFRQTAAA